MSMSQLNFTCSRDSDIHFATREDRGPLLTMKMIGREKRRVVKDLSTRRLAYL